MAVAGTHRRNPMGRRAAASGAAPVWFGGPVRRCRHRRRRGRAMRTPGAALEVLATGPLALIQDLGRPGLAVMGVGRSGAADRQSFQLGARLVAQDYTAASIEVTFGGLAVRARGDVMLVLTGAPAPAEVEGAEVAHLAP